MNRQRPPTNARRMRGFSLIEMVAAFLVFAIGIGVLMQVLAGSMRNTRQSSDYTMAALWAQSKLDAVGVGEQIESGRSSGRFDDVYSWELDVQLVDASAIEPPPQPSLNAGNQIGTQQNGRQNAQQNGRMSVANAGLGGGMQATPFDLYQVDLTVYWGGRFGGRPRTATFSTLRSQNPDPNGGMQGVGLNQRSGLSQRPGTNNQRFGGGTR